ncbi:MAG: MotA/TolQ/ExbB proton channel family protein [Desulfobacterales bacterium]|nr:MotA/TolQ/ExbB proton channel family protein [Desulfobacterales bacterium]
MKTIFHITAIILTSAFAGIFLFMVQPVLCQDMREIRIEARKIEADMKHKAALELRAAKQSAIQSRQRVTADRKKLNKAIADLEQKTRELKIRIKSLDIENEQLTVKDKQLSNTLEASQSMVKELTGCIRTNAKDITNLVDSSLLSGVFQPDTAFLKSIADNTLFPGMDHIQKMTELVFELIQRAGSVCIETGPIVNQAGRTVDSQVLLVGSFTAAFRKAGETGFLTYTHGEKKLYALSRPPTRSIQNKINAYMDGKREAVPMDISRGGALAQLSHQLSLWQQIPKGGPIIYPILAILFLGGLITLERIFFFLRRKIRLENIWGKIETSARKRNWEGCTRACDRYAKNPVIRVIRAGVHSRDLPREDMENAVQEAILKEIPPMERFLSTMGMLAIITPLLGLLGTVTGMIDTFHVITLHGTGDPRMMSGGISEALVTTMLGLSVAIPIMLVHTLLSRTVENTIGMMEEKAVALINIVQTIKGS